MRSEEVLWKRYGGSRRFVAIKEVRVITRMNSRRFDESPTTWEGFITSLENVEVTRAFEGV